MRVASDSHRLETTVRADPGERWCGRELHGAPARPGTHARPAAALLLALVALLVGSGPVAAIEPAPALPAPAQQADPPRGAEPAGDDEREEASDDDTADEDVTRPDEEGDGDDEDRHGARSRHGEDDEDDDESDDDERRDRWRDDLVVTQHAVTIGGGTVAYTATAGTLTLATEHGDEEADLFFVAYERDGDKGAARPVTFCFNGGPGSSSVWLHLGAFGPKRVPLPDDAAFPAPPYALVENVHSLLDVTDLVFIDPVTTGYSRAAEGKDASEFHGVEQDLDAVARFIRLWTTRFLRWDSPKFLAGESYGTTRAAGLAGLLQDRWGMYLNGVVLVSTILDFGTARFDPGNDRPYALFLPTYTATAAHHGRLAPELAADLPATLAEVEAFALGEYWLALARGSTLPADERAALAQRLARYTGLSPEWIDGCHLRIEIHEFVKELRRDERLTVGRLDSRYVGRDRDAAGATSEYDPSYAAIQGPYTAMLNHYVRAELQYESDLPYEVLSGRVHPWNFGNLNRYVNTAETLRSALEKNPHLRVFCANGLYDLATPYFATEHTFAHFGYEPDLLARVTMADYPAGHMMYVHEPSLARLKADLAAFYAAAAPAR